MTATMPAVCRPCPIMALATDAVVPRIVREAIATRDQAEHAHLLVTYNRWRVRARPDHLDLAMVNLREWELMVCERPLDLRPKRFARSWDVAWKTPKRAAGAVESSTSRTPIAPTDRSKITW